MFDEINEKLGPYYYLVFRVIIGLMFLGHGLMKFGIIGTSVAPAFSLFWFAGIIEVTIGPLIALGALVRLAAVIGILEMLYAYLTVHLARGLIPFQNGGEAAVLFLAAFFVLKRYGAGEYSLEKAIRGKELF